MMINHMFPALAMDEFRDRNRRHHRDAADRRSPAPANPSSPSVSTTGEAHRR